MSDPTVAAPAAAPAAAPVDRFFVQLGLHLVHGSLTRLVLAKPAAPGPDDADLVRLTVRPLALRGEPHLSFVYSHATRDITHNHPVPVGLTALRGLVGKRFRHAHLLAAGEDLELRFSKKGQASLHQPTNAREATAPQAHDREKQRHVTLDLPFLAALGVTAPDGQLVPAMARKFKQINKFVEILDHAVLASPLKAQTALRVADFGSGKGYLTFAVHHHLRHSLGRDAAVTGVEFSHTR